MESRGVGSGVTLRRQGGEALLTVRDDGIGIAPDQQARVWQRFYQVDPFGERRAAPVWACLWSGRLPRPTADT